MGCWFSANGGDESVGCVGCEVGGEVDESDEADGFRIEVGYWVEEKSHE